MSLSIHTMKALPDEGGWSVGYWLQVEEFGEYANALAMYEWQEICQFKETLDAVRRVNLLNGGPGAPSPPSRLPWEE